MLIWHGRPAMFNQFQFTLRDLFLLAVIAVVAAGCGEPPAPPASNPVIVTAKPAVEVKKPEDNPKPAPPKESGDPIHQVFAKGDDDAALEWVKKHSKRIGDKYDLDNMAI